MSNRDADGAQENARVTRKLRSVKRRNILLRVASATLTLGTIAALYLYSDPFGWFMALAAVSFAAIPPVVGPLMSIFTLWSGRFVDSCPNCPDVRLRRIEISVERCDWCGHDWVKVDPVSGETRTHVPDEPGHYEYCSISCQKSHRNSRKAVQ